MGLGVLGTLGGKSCWILCQARSLIISASSFSSSIPARKIIPWSHFAINPNVQSYFSTELFHFYLRPHSFHLSCSRTGWRWRRACWAAECPSVQHLPLCLWRDTSVLPQSPIKVKTSLSTRETWARTENPTFGQLGGSQ